METYVCKPVAAQEFVVRESVTFKAFKEYSALESETELTDSNQEQTQISTEEKYFSVHARMKVKQKFNN